MGLRASAPAKLNRCLLIQERRADGFHLLELVTTVLHDVDGLVDQVELNHADTHAFTLSGPLAEGLAMDEDNLVVRAWRLLEAEAGRSLPVRLHLEKHIPAGGGLGGGSSDAATTLRAGRDFLGLDISDSRLLELAARLGSDVPLFLLGGTSLCLDRGERVFPLRPIPLEPMLLVHPRMHVSTPAVYRALASVGYPEPASVPSLPEGVTPPWRNDLRAAALAVEPRLAEVEHRLADLGGDPLLCGSGACWVARFPDAASRDSALNALRAAKPDWGVWAVA